MGTVIREDTEAKGVGRGDERGVACIDSSAVVNEIAELALDSERAGRADRGADDDAEDDAEGTSVGTASVDDDGCEDSGMVDDCFNPGG